jgi:hypothetical protein
MITNQKMTLSFWMSFSRSCLSFLPHYTNSIIQPGRLLGIYFPPAILYTKYTTFNKKEKRYNKSGIAYLNKYIDAHS